ncbi:hypothetical protein GCM10027259_34930 [Micromonospora palomenae]
MGARPGIRGPACHRRRVATLAWHLRKRSPRRDTDAAAPLVPGTDGPERSFVPDNVAGEATRISKQTEGLLTQTHPLLARALRPRVQHPAGLLMLQQFSSPAR